MENIDIEREVQSAMPALLVQVRERLTQRLLGVAEDTAMQEVRKAVQEWAVANLVPEIKAQLEAGKDGMIKQAQTISQQLGEALGEAMAGQASKSLASSHVVTDIAQKLFRGY